MRKEMETMAEIQLYINKTDGKTYYQFQVYTGVNTKTGKRTQTRRRFFKTKTAAKQALKDTENQVMNGTYHEEHKFRKQQMTLSEVFKKWYDLRKLVVTGSTLISYKACFQRFKKINEIKEQFTNLYTEDELMELLVTLKEKTPL